MNKKLHQTVLFVIVLASLSIRLHLALTSSAVPDYADMALYRAAAMEPGIPSTVPPAYPLFLRAVYGLFGAENNRAVYMIQGILGCITVLLLYRIARKVSSDRAALIAAGIAALYPNLAAYGAVVMTETIGLLAATALTALLLSSLGEGRKAVAAAFVLGIGFLVRPVFLFFAPGVFLCVRRRLAFTAAAVIFLAPPIAWEMVAGGSLERAAVGMYKTYHPPVQGYQIIDPRKDLAVEGNEAARVHIGRSLAFIKDNVSGVAEKIHTKALVLVTNGWDRYVLDPVVGDSRNISYIMSYAYLPIMLLGFIGMARYLGAGTCAVAVPALTYTALTILLSIFKYRYRLFLEPVLIIFASMLLGGGRRPSKGNGAAHD